MNFEIQFARVTNFGKLQDRFLTCQHIKSADLAKSSMGDVFALMEILSPWFPTAQIGQLIINNFSKSYWLGGSTSDLLNFEEALKKVNEGLAEATQNGETDWIGNLNGILAVIVDNNLHLAVTGRAEAYLFRDGKLNHLTEDAQGGIEVHPLKTFSNVISGELKAHDKILIANKDLFDQLSIESIRQIITLNNPSVAASQINKLLRKSHIRKINLIIIDLYSKDEISSETISPNPEEVFYLDKSGESILGRLNSIGNTLSPISKVIGSMLIKGIKAIGGLVKRKPVTLKEKDEASPTQDKFHKEFLADEERDGLLKDEKINYSPEYVHYYNSQKQKGQSQPFLSKGLSISKNIGLKLWLVLKTISNWILNIARDKNRRKFLYIGVAVILVLIIGLIIGLRAKSSKVGNLEAQKILDEAISLEKQGESLISAGKDAEAKEKLALAIEKAIMIKDSTFVGGNAKEVLANAYQNLDKLTSTSRFNNLNSAVTLQDQAKGLIVISGDVFLYTDDSIYKGSLLGGEPTKVTSIGKGKGNIIAATRADKIIYLYTSNQYLFEFNSVTSKLNQVSIADSKWETANAIASYVGTMYLLDGVLGQIYKHTSNQDTFAAGDSYINPANINLKQAVSLAIDGNVYVLKGNGQVLKIQKSKLQDFSLQDTPSPWDKITEPIKIFTDSDTPSIYVLDNGQKRILEYDKDGHYIHQYAFDDNLDKITDFNVSSKARKIWILVKGGVYEINI